MRRMLLVLALALGLGAGWVASWDTWDVPEGTPRHAVVIVIDTLRADALERAHTPNIDALAAQGDSAELAWAAGTWTGPSVASIFTGMSLREHGWDMPFPSVQRRKNKAFPELPDTPMLAEVLAAAGFETAGYYANRVVSWPIGFGRGFDRWEYVDDDALVWAVRTEMPRWLDGRRHFLYVHFRGPHQPIRPSPEARARWGIAEVRADRGFNRKWALADLDERGELYERAYHAKVEDIDAQVGDVLEALGPVRDDTAIVLLSDHGEMLGEHGRIGHGRALYETLTHVPFIAVGAGELPEMVSTAALPHLVTSALGVSHDWATRKNEVLVSQREGDLALTADGRRKAVWTEDGLTVYSLRDDPLEQRPLDGRTQELEALRSTWEQATPAGRIEGAEVEASDDLLDALRTLGYVD